MTHDAYALNVRQVALEMDALPTHWFGDTTLLTHALNAQLLFLPEGERFVIRTMRRYLNVVADPTLRTAVKDFIRQEAVHGAAHNEAVDRLRDQGFAVDRWLEGCDRGVRGFERVAPPWLCLSVAAAMEHIIASAAEAWLTDGHMDKAHPELQALIGWHAAEEIEHKAVVFDVLASVETRHAHRMAGMAIAAPVMLLWLLTATLVLLWQDPTATVDRVRIEAADASLGPIGLARFVWRHTRAYLRRGFHPDHIDNRQVAADYLASIAERVRPVRCA